MVRVAQSYQIVDWCGSANDKFIIFSSVCLRTSQVTQFNPQNISMFRCTELYRKAWYRAVASDAFQIDQNGGH
jgi:hypothetical protein